MHSLPLPAVLGIWVFGAVCLAIVIVTLSLKHSYEKEQRAKAAQSGR